MSLSRESLSFLFAFAVSSPAQPLLLLLRSPPLSTPALSSSKPISSLQLSLESLLLMLLMQMQLMLLMRLMRLMQLMQLSLPPLSAPLRQLLLIAPRQRPSCPLDDA